MAFEYFLYRTDYNNTLVDRGATSFAPLPPNTGEIFIEFPIPQNQPLYFYKEQSASIVLNDESTIDTYLNDIEVETPDSYATIGQLTGYTATTNTELTNKVVWKGVWSGGTYQKNDMVLDGVWTMVANKETTDIAAPQKVGVTEDLYSPNNPSISGTTAKQVVFGMQYSGDQPYWINSYRVFVIAGNDYNIVLVKDPYGANEATFLNIFRATVTGWRDFGLVPRPVASGTTFQLMAIVQEPDPTPTITDIDYNYQKFNNWTAPSTGQIVHANKRLQVLSIHHSDQDSIDRTAFLNSLVAGDIISVGNTNWSVQNNVDVGTYNDITVAPATQASVSNVQTFSFETVTATPISIGIDPNFWSGSTLIKGVYIKNGNWDNAVVDDNQYGIDIGIQNASLSPDWDFVTAQGNGGGGTSNASWGGIDGDILNQIDLQNQFNSKLDESTLTGYTATTETRLSGIEADITYISGQTGGDNKLDVIVFTAYTATTNTRLNEIESDITYVSGITNSKLSIAAFNSYSAATLTNINSRVLSSIFNTYTGVTAPATYQSKSSIVTLTGTTLPNQYAAKSAFLLFTGTTAPATYQTKTSIATLTGSTLPNTYVAKSVFSTYTGGTTNVTSAGNGIRKNGNNIRLGGSLTGSTNIGLGTFNLVFTGASGTLRYGSDLSAQYNVRSLVDKGFVTGLTSQVVYGTQYHFASAYASTSTNSTTPVEKLSLVTGSLPSGTYKIIVHWVWSRNSAANSARFNITVNGSPQGTRGTMEMEGGDTTDVRPETRILYIALSGVATIALNHWGESGGNSTTTSDATIELIRVQ